MVLENLEPKEVFRFFEEICQVPHGTFDTKRISDYCVAFAKERGLACIQDETNNIIISKPGTVGYENSEPVIIQGHMDMVCEKRPESNHDFKKDPLELYVEDGYVKARSVEQTEVFKAAETFARVEGILPAPESSHAIKVAIDEALKCKETGEEKNIVFGLTGTGYFDMYAYQKYNDGEMSDYIPTDEEIAKSLAKLPVVD